MPDNEMKKPRSSAARATSRDSVKQWKTPRARGPVGALLLQHDPACRRWRTARVDDQRQVQRRAARMCTRKRSRCHSMSAMVRPCQAVVVQPGLADGDHLGQAAPRSTRSSNGRLGHPRCPDARPRVAQKLSCPGQPVDGRRTPPASCRCTGRGAPGPAASRPRICGRSAGSSGKLRWQWESVNMRTSCPLANRPAHAQTAPAAALRWSGSAGRADRGTQDFLDLELEQLGLVVLGKLDADALACGCRPPWPA
jgi:hypothetical protein